ncbi:MAG: hypothetical protein M3Y58_11555 [Chloroflexota bacterium]|nr:hypothetical protein [Chloroflexota bacterium]
MTHRLLSRHRVAMVVENAVSPLIHAAAITRDSFNESAASPPLPFLTSP